MKKTFFAGLMLALLSFAFIVKTNRTITGTIKDENGNPVPFATITVVGTNNTTASDANGKFSLLINDKTKAIKVSSVGFVSQVIKLFSKVDYTIVLKTQTSKLDEVVVIGYGAVNDNATADVLAPQISGKVYGISVNKINVFNIQRQE